MKRKLEKIYSCSNKKYQYLIIKMFKKKIVFGIYIRLFMNSVNSLNCKNYIKQENVIRFAYFSSDQKKNPKPF